MQRRHRRGLSTAGGAGQGPEPGSPLASDSEDDELPWRPALGDTASPRVVLESDPEEPDVCPDVRGPRKRRRALAPGRHPDAAAPCPHPDVGGPKKRRFGPPTPPDPDVGRKMAVPDVQPPNGSLNPPKLASPDVKHLALAVESDTNVKVPPETALFHPNRHRAALEVSSNPDVEEREPNPDVGGAKSGSQMLVVDSDTDVEEAEALPDVGCPKIRSRAPNVQENPGGEVEPPNPDVGGPKNGCWTPGDSDTDVEVENLNSAVEGPKNGHGMLAVDSDTDVEEDRADPDVGYPKTHQATQNIPKNQNVEMEARNADVEGSQKGRGMLAVDSDTDVEENGADPDVGYPKTHQMTQNIPKNRNVEMEARNADVEGSQKGRGMLVVDSDTDVEEDRADPDVGCPQNHQTTQNVPKNQNVEMEARNADVEGSQKGRAMLVVDSDTDVEEDASNPDVGTPKPHRATQNIQKNQNVEMEARNADVEGSQKGRGMLAVDSDTDVEEDRADPDVGYPKTHQATQNIPKNQNVEMEAQNADVEGSQKGRGMLAADSDTDVEEDASNPDVGTPKPHRATQNIQKNQNVEMEARNADVEGSQKGRGMLAVDSDTDVEEDASNPDVGTPKPHRATQNVPRNPEVETKGPNPRAEGPRNEHWTLVADSDTDVEENEANPNVGRPKIRRIPRKAPDVAMKKPNPDVDEPPNDRCNLEVDSDTDVEEENRSHRVLCPKSHKTPRNIWKDPTVVMETPNPDVGGLSRGSVASSGDSDTDVEDLNAFPSVGAPKLRGTTHEVMDTVAKMAAAPDVDPEGPTRPNNDPDVKVTSPTPDVGAPKAQCPLLNVDSDTDVEDNGVIPDVGGVRGCRGASGGPDVATRPPNPDVSSPASPGDGSDTDMEEVAPTPDVRSLRRRIRIQNRPRPDVGSPTTGSDAMGADPKRRESPPKGPSLSPKSHGDASAEGPVPNRHDSAAATAVEAPTPDVGARHRNGETPLRGEDPAVPPDVPPPKSPRLLSNLGVTGDADGPRSAGATPGGDTGATVTESDTDVEEDPDLFLEPTQNFLPPVTEDVTPNWDPEEPTQRFFLPKEEEEPPQDPPDAWVPPAEPVTVTPAREGTGTGAAPCGEVGEGPRRSQRLARSRGGGATGGGATGGGASGRGGAGRVGGGATPVPGPVRRSPRLQARPPPPEPPVTKGRDQEEPRPPPKPRPHRAGPAPSKRQAQEEEEEEPAEVTGHQLRPRGGPGSAPPKVLFTGVVASPGMEVALKTLGGSMATSVFDCTHLVTDRVRRTVKFLCAVARGVPIVTPEWLHKSARSGRVLGPGPFLVRDSQQERHFGFSLAQALRRARRHPLLQGYEVHVTPNVRPEPEHMRDIVTCSGGTFLPTMPHAYAPRRLVITCEADAGRWAPALSARLPLASPELLLTGLLRQRLELPPFLLPAPPPPETQPPTPPLGACGGGLVTPLGVARTPPAAPGAPRGGGGGVAGGRRGSHLG
ncbi:mediator of DNA damage checkpoint protein 1 [Theristicus caerulescens]